MVSSGRGRGVGTKAICVVVGVVSLALGSLDVRAAVQDDTRGARVAPAGRTVIEAELYLPPAAAAYDVVDPATGKPKVVELKPSLVLRGHGLPDGVSTIAWRFDAASCKGGEAKIAPSSGRFETFVTPGPCAEARSVVWEFGAGAGRVKGTAPLAFARFRGQIVYRDGKQRPAYIDLRAVDFGAPGEYRIPVADDGRFDARVPARVYSSVNVNSAFYSREAMERWAWDYDLTKDREDTFTIGRTELYSMHAWELIGGQPLVFVTFRPSALTRIAAFDRNGDMQLDPAERDVMMEAMKKSPTVIGPELEAGDIKAWIDGVPHPIARVDRIPEASAVGIWQVEYLVQITPARKPARGVRHEVRLEVESKETLHGQPMVDYGQGSAGFWRQ